jgi:hypothetical protein
MKIAALAHRSRNWKLSLTVCRLQCSYSKSTEICTWGSESKLETAGLPALRLPLATRDRLVIYFSISRLSLIQIDWLPPLAATVNDLLQRLCTSTSALRRRTRGPCPPIIPASLQVSAFLVILPDPDARFIFLSLEHKSAPLPLRHLPRPFADERTL